MAKEKLRKQKVLVTEITSLEGQKRKSVLTPSQLLGFTRELAQLLKAGLPLYESLVTLEEKQKKTKNHALFIDLCDRLKNGYRFSSALSEYPETFDRIYLSMVSSAERSGSLSDAFEQLGFLISKQQKLRKQLVSSLAYPAFLGAFCLIVIGVLFFFVIPSMKELLEDRALHPLTRTVLFLSDFLRTQGFFLLGGTVALFFAVFTLSRTVIVQRKIGEVLLKLPYCKKIIIESSLVRFFRTMTMLLSGGVPLVEALCFSKKTVGNRILQDLIEETELRMGEGKKMSRLFSGSVFIPSLVIRMLTIGEETGNMGGMMQNLAEIYEEELDKNLAHFVTFLQPAVLIFLGGVVGVVILSILLPLTDVSSFVSS